jgi:SWIM/SEC-C metal-binding protein
MAKLGTNQRPAVARVQTMKRAEEIAKLCEKNGWIYIVGIEPDKPEDISDIIKLLNPSEGMRAAAVPGRNDPCPCGSGLKYKNCCMKKS